MVRAYWYRGQVPNIPCRFEGSNLPPSYYNYEQQNTESLASLSYVVQEILGSGIILSNASLVSVVCMPSVVFPSILHVLTVCPSLNPLYSNARRRNPPYKHVDGNIVFGRLLNREGKEVEGV